jgi:pimeloyl-ACP methyl ester carboxylesterase
MTPPTPPPVADYPLTTGRLTVPGGSVYYEVTGTGPAVVFLHGLGGNHRSWWQQVPVFRLEFTCVTLAHRGFAPSTDETGLPRPELFASDLAALLDHLDIHRAALVAQSMGGWTALEFALANPHRVGALAMCGTSGSLRHPDLVGLTGIAGHALRERGFHPASGERMAREQPRSHALYREIDRASGDWDRAPVRERLDAMRVRDPAELGRLRFRVLAITGAEDLVCPPGNVRQLVGALPSSQLVQVHWAGHSVYFERPALFNQLVLRFLRSTSHTSTGRVSA